MSTSSKHSKRSSGSMKEDVYHGLINQGSTCYLNSVLQVLFMTREFREAVKRYAAEHEDTSRIDKQLSALFDSLRRSTATTVGVTTKLGIHNVNKQSDAAEHLEKILALSSHEASRIFQGKLVHKTTCLKCISVTNAEEHFWFLPLTLDDSCNETYSVRDGIAEFFKKSVLSGDDQLYCDDCDDKSDASMVCEVGHHPEVLILLLKRFEFNYNYMSFVKNSCPVVVPCSLEMPQEQIYELYGFIEHFGSLKSGHYTSTVKSQDDREARWYNFNDSSVAQLNRNRSPMDNNKNYPSESQSAYVLFYRKRKHTNNNRKPSTSSSIHNDQRWDVAKKDGGDGEEEAANDRRREKSVVLRPSPDASHAAALDNRASGKQRSPKTRVSDDRKAGVGAITESRADDDDAARDTQRISKKREIRHDGQGSVKAQEREKGKAAGDKVVQRSEERSGGHGRASQDKITRVTTNSPPAIRRQSTPADAPEGKKKTSSWSKVKRFFTRKDKKTKKKAKAKRVKEIKEQKSKKCWVGCLSESRVSD